MSNTEMNTNVTDKTKYKHRPNIINLDFVNAPSCNKVIAFNLALLPPVLPARPN